MAQSVDLNFPPIASGYDQQLGVTVLSRPRTLYDATGIRIGSFLLNPSLGQSLDYNSNPTSSPAASGSVVSTTSAGVSANSLWSRDSLGVSAGVDHVIYASLRDASYTDWNLGLRGGYTIGDGQLTGAFAHQSYHQIGETIGTVRSDTPVADTTDTAQINDTLAFNRIDVSPDFSVSAYRYGTASIGGVRLDQSYLDRNVLAGGITTGYSMTDIGSLLVVARTTAAHYLHGLAGAPSNDSRSGMLLSGIDYQAKGLWRYRLLLGAELTTFAAAQYATRVTPVVEAQVTYTPTGLTTLTGSLRRAISDPLSAGTSGFILTSADLRVDHELLRNVILQGRGGVQYAQYLQGGTQTAASAGASIDWLFARGARVSFTADVSHQSAATLGRPVATPNTPQTSGITQGVVGVALSLGL